MNTKRSHLRFRQDARSIFRLVGRALRHQYGSSPLWGLLLIFCSSTILYYYCQPSQDLCLGLLCLSLCLVMPLLAMRFLGLSRKKHPRSLSPSPSWQRPLEELTLGLVIATLYTLYLGYRDGAYLRSYPERSYHKALLTITRPAEPVASGYRLYGRLNTLEGGESYAVVCYQRAALHPAPEIGDQLLLSGVSLKKLKAPSPTRLSYYHNRGFFYELDYQKLYAYSSSSAPSLFEGKAYFLYHREKLYRRLMEQPLNPSAKALIAALCLGRQDDSSAARLLKEQFRLSGMSHLLVVSGMHLGLLYLSLTLLLGFIPLFKKHRKPKIALLLILIWLFTALTGLGIATQRAALMLSLYLLSRLLGRPLKGVPLWVLSATMQLLLSPLSLTEWGFLMSYGAVLSILLYLPLLQKAFLGIRWQVLRYTIDISLIGIAVLPILFPLNLYLFGYFPLGSLLVLLPATILLYPLFFLGLVALLPPEGVSNSILELINLCSNALISLSQRVGDQAMLSLTYSPSLLETSLELLLAILLGSMLGYCSQKGYPGYYYRGTSSPIELLPPSTKTGEATPR